MKAVVNHNDPFILPVFIFLILTLSWYARAADSKKTAAREKSSSEKQLHGTSGDFRQWNDLGRAMNSIPGKAQAMTGESQPDTVPIQLNRSNWVQRGQLPDSDLAMVYVEKAVVAGKSGKYSQSLMLLDSAESFISGLRPGTTHMHIYWRKATGLLISGRYDESLDFCQKAAKLALIFGEKEVLISTYINIGTIFYETGRKQDALTYYRKALELSLKSKNDKFTATCYTCLANTYVYDSVKLAINLYKKTIALHKRTGNDYGLQATYNNIGSMYLFEKKYDSSLVYLGKATEYAGKNHDYYSAIAAYGNAATAWAYLGMEDNTGQNLQEALTVAQSTNTSRGWALYYNVLSETDIARGDYKNAFKNQQRYHEITDSLNQEKNQQIIAELETRYKTQQVEIENQKLIATNSQSEINLQKQKNLRNLFIVLSVGLLIIIGLTTSLLVILHRSREKIKKQFEIIDEKNHHIETLLKEIHHSVKNNLSTVQSILNLQKRSTENHETIAVIEDIQSRINTITELHKHLYLSDEPGFIELKKYFTSIAEMNSKLFPSVTGRITRNVYMEETWVDKKLGLILGIIVSEMIMNSYKYAFNDNHPGDVTIEMIKKDRMATLTLSDTGNGYSTDKSTIPPEPGLGIRLIRLLVNSINGKLTSETRGGTKYAIVFALEQP